MAVQTRSGRLSDYLLQADSAEEKATADIPYILGVTSQRPPTLARSPELLALMITPHRKKRLCHRGTPPDVAATFPTLRLAAALNPAAVSAEPQQVAYGHQQPSPASPGVCRWTLGRQILDLVW